MTFFINLGLKSDIHLLAEAVLGGLLQSQMFFNNVLPLYLAPCHLHIVCDACSHPFLDAVDDMV